MNTLPTIAPNSTDELTTLRERVSDLETFRTDALSQIETLQQDVQVWQAEVEDLTTSLGEVQDAVRDLQRALQAR